MTCTYLSDRQIVEYCQQFDRHVDWLQCGWENYDPEIQALHDSFIGLHETKNDLYQMEDIKRRHGHGDLEILVGSVFPSKEPLIISVDKTRCVDNLLVNTAGFFEGEVRRLADLGLPDYHFEPFNVVAKNKKDLKAEIKKYGEYLHGKYSGDYGKIYVKYI